MVVYVERHANCNHRTQAMHKGVERDVEKQRVRQERQAEFAMQKALEEQYLKLQNVSPSTDDQSGSGGPNNAGQGT